MTQNMTSRFELGEQLGGMMAAMALDYKDEHDSSSGAHAAAVHDPHVFLPNAGASPRERLSMPPPMHGIVTMEHAEDELPPPPDMQEGEDPLTASEKSNLYVSNISPEVTDDELREMFTPFGTILNSRIMVDIHTCKSRGFGFVQFSQPSEAAAAVRGMDGSVHAGQTLMVRLASRRTRQPGELTAKIFLRNVPAGVSEDDLRRMCSTFGTVTTCAVRRDVQHGVVTDASTGGMSQVAYITFADVEAAKKAVAVLSNMRPWSTSIHPLLAKVLDSNQKRRPKESEEGGSAPVSPQPATGSPRMGSLATPATSLTSMANHSRTSGHNTASSVMAANCSSGSSVMYHQQLPAAYPTGMSGGMHGVLGPQPGMMPAMPTLPGMAPPGMQGIATHPGMHYPPLASGLPYHPGLNPSGLNSALAPFPAAPLQTPTGYQVVMQPTLQPVYGPTLGVHPGSVPLSGYHGGAPWPSAVPMAMSLPSSTATSFSNRSQAASANSSAHAQQHSPGSRVQHNPFAR